MNSAIAKYLVWSPILWSRGQNIWPLMREFRETQYRPPHVADAQRLSAFKRVFAHACDLPFYREKYRSVGITPRDIHTWEDVTRIPVLTKQEILEQAEPARVRGRGREFRRSTSGSTGRPLVFYKDAESMSYMDAILYRNYSWYGVGVGDRQARFWGHPLTRWGKLKTRALDSALNRTRLSAFDLHETSYRAYLQRMERFGAQYIYGYAQSIFQFASYFHRSGRSLAHLKLKAVILTGEMVFPHQVAVMGEVFGCPVTQEYGCTEVGIIAFGCAEGTMHLMENLLVETLPLPGKEGEGLVVSELYGTLFPFIRYQIGDRGKVSSRPCRCGRQLKVLEELSGRKDDFILCPDGRLIDPYVVEYGINEMPATHGKVQQFKVVQKEVTSLQIMVVGEGNPELVAGYLRGKTRKLLPDTMQVQVEMVQALPKELSGKLRCFISLLNS